MFINAIGQSLRRSNGPYLLATLIFMVSFGPGILMVSTVSMTTIPIVGLPLRPGVGRGRRGLFDSPNA